MERYWKSNSKRCFDALIKLGDGDLLKGLFQPRADMNNPYENGKIKNRQLGL